MDLKKLAPWNWFKNEDGRNPIISDFSVKSAVSVYSSTV